MEYDLTRLFSLTLLFYSLFSFLGPAFGAHFYALCFHKDIAYLIEYQLTKFQCHTFFLSQDIKQNVSGSYLDN